MRSFSSPRISFSQKQQQRQQQQQSPSIISQQQPINSTSVMVGRGGSKQNRILSATTSTSSFLHKKRWSIGGGGSNSSNSIKNAAVDTAWTIDDALHGLYDENDCDHHTCDDVNTNNNSSSNSNDDVVDKMDWWNIDDGVHYATKKERNFILQQQYGRSGVQQRREIDNDNKNGTDYPTNKNNNSETGVAANDDDENSNNTENDDNDDDEDANVTTTKLYRELYTDPLIAVLEIIANNNNNRVSNSNDDTSTTINDTTRSTNKNKNDVCTDDVDDDDDDNDDFGDFQSAAASSSPQRITVDDNETSKPITTDGRRRNQSPNECHSQIEQLQFVVRAISFDDDDNEELIRYVDTLLLCQTNNATGSPNTSSTTIATNALSSSLGTPDLVRMVDDIVDASTTTTTTSLPTRMIFACHNDENDNAMVVVDIDDPKDTLVSPSSLPHESIITENKIVVVATPPPPLSMQLPVGDDLSTLESRFIRRLQQMYYSDHSLLQDRNDDDDVDLAAKSKPNVVKSTYPELPTYYFTSPDLDDSISVLQSMPWEYVLSSNTRGVGSFDAMAVNNSSSEIDESCTKEEVWGLWDDYITSRLCQLDTALKDVQADTLQQIQPHQERISITNALIHECDQNVRLSFMYYERSQQAINALMGSEDQNIGLVGPSILLRVFQQRDEYRQLVFVLDQLNDIWACERDLMNRIDRFDVKHCNALDEYFAVMKLANDLDGRVSDTRLTQLHCLVDLRNRLKSIGMRFWLRLLDIARAIVIRTCRDNSSFDGDQYERVLRAMIDLKSQSIVDTSVASIDLSKSWTENVLNTESYEVDRVFASALLKPTNCNTSSHEMELKQFAYELDLHWGDYTKLREILRNLANIRFDFEWQFHYLPRVFHQLCKQLTDILLSHSLFVKWHRDSSQNQSFTVSSDPSEEVVIEHSNLTSIYNLMSSYTSKLWEHCEGILSNCLDEYLSLSPKQPLFKRGANGTDDTLWRENLERLHNVYSLANTFISLKKSFLELNESPDVQRTSQCLLTQKLSSIFGRNLRALHVDAMNTLGRCLANESWILGSFIVSSEPERTGQPELSIEAILVRAMQAASRRSEPVSNDVKNSICELSCSYDSRCLIARLEANENPFDGVFRSNLNRNASCEAFAPNEDVELSDHIVYRTLSTFIHEHDGSIRLAPDSVSKELIAWFARLLFVLEKLPLIAEDVSNVFIHLCDLYITTVFRLCSGYAKNERLILGEDSPLPIYIHPDEHKGNEKGNAPPMFGSFRNTPKKSGSVKNISRRSIVPVNLDAEICFPRPRYRAEAHILHEFINRAQKSLRDAVNLDMIDSWLVDPNIDSPEEQGCEVTRVLIKREGSISSCYTVAALIEVAQKVARQNQSSLLPQEFMIDMELSTLRSYSQSVLDIIPSFARVARQIACTRAIAGASVVKDILRVDSVWEECELHEYANDYIDDLSYRCALIWGYLAASNKLPLIIMRETWEGIVSASYLSLLDGFSRIRNCSTEGRSLMALDLASFKAGLSPTSIAERMDGVVLVSKPPPINPEINFFYVETYIKVFYYPTDDVFNWIKENCDKYSFSHNVGLCAAVFLSSQEQNSEESFNDMLRNIKTLYSIDDTRESISIRQV